MVLSSHDSFFKRLYRLPFDMIEQYTTGLADVIYANSVYTLSVFFKTFTKISAKKETERDLILAADPKKRTHS